MYGRFPRPLLLFPREAGNEKKAGRGAAKLGGSEAWGASEAIVMFINKNY